MATASHAETHISALPEDLLAACFASVPFLERWAPLCGLEAEETQGKWP